MFKKIKRHCEKQTTSAPKQSSGFKQKTILFLAFALLLLFIPLTPLAADYTQIPPPTIAPPTAAPKTYKAKLEFPVNKNYFYLMSYGAGISDPLSIAYITRVKTTMDVNTIFNDRMDRVLIPVRYFAESLGYNVNWDASSGTVSIIAVGTSVSMQIGSDYLIKNNEIIKMDEPLQVQNDRTYLPVRFVGEAFGFDVYWDAPPQRVLLYK